MMLKFDHSHYVPVLRFKRIGESCLAKTRAGYYSIDRGSPNRRLRTDDTAKVGAE